MKAYRLVRKQFQVPNPFRTKNLTMRVNALSYHSLTEPPPLEPLSSEWRERTLSKLIKLTPLLKNLDLINGKLVNVHEKSVVNDEFLLQSMHTFKSLGRVFLLYQSIQQTLSLSGKPCISVNKPTYTKPIAMDSLKKVCDILDVSAQQRKLVRLAICPQVTQHQIWIGALEEILNQLKFEMGVRDYMAKQIVVNCLSFLNDAMSYDPDSTSWMRLAPKKDANFPPSAKWDDFLEMYNDLINCLKNDHEYGHEFFFFVTKLETMKEGLLQIKDVLVDKNIGYKEARHQENLVQKKLTKSLGHSSRCLFTLLLYYLYGSIRDIELDICCWFSDDVGKNCCLCVGKILTSDGEKILRRELKKLERAIRVIKFVYEMAEMKEVLEVQGHLWCIGCKNRSLTYKGHEFFIHGISLSLS